MIEKVNFRNKKGEILDRVGSVRIPRALKLKRGVARPVPDQFREFVGKWLLVEDGSRTWEIRKDLKSGFVYLSREHVTEESEAVPEQLEMTEALILTDIPVLHDKKFRKTSFFHDVYRVVGNKPMGEKILETNSDLNFSRCCLVNTEPPLGSIISRCSTHLVEHNITEGFRILRVNGQTFRKPLRFNRVHGKYRTTGYVYYDEPVIVPLP